MKRGILLAAFGVGNRQARHTLQLFDRQVRRRWPDIPVRWAYTSALLRHRLAARRTKSDSVTKALHKMYFEKYTHIAVQPLHVIPGVEYDGLHAAAMALMCGAGRAELSTVPRMEGSALESLCFSRVSVGRPLLYEHLDILRTVDALLDSLPRERAPQDAVVFMGHGTWHAGENRYEALFTALRKRDPLVFVGTMEGSLTITDVVKGLRQVGVKKTFLLPLLSVVGRHAVQDMAGEGADSWRSHIEGAGMECVPVLRGMVEYAGLVDIWIEHLADAVNQLEV